MTGSTGVQEEFREEATGGLSAKEEWLVAETAEQFEPAKRKMDIFCND